MAEPIATGILAVWNEPDADVRRAIIEKTTTPDLIYDDVHKNAQIHGQDAFFDFIAFFRSRVSGVHMTKDGEIEQLNGVARIRFALMRGETVFSRGTYFATIVEDGRISGLFGFIDQEPG